YGNSGNCSDSTQLELICNPPCDAPTNLTATNITSVSATLGWTSDGALFDVEWGVAGFTQGSGTTVTDITTNSYDLTNLDYQTQYQFYVRQDCTLNESDWVGPFAFTTLSQCPTGDVSFDTQLDVVNFVANYPNCTHLPGNLNITGPDFSLQPLNNITSIGGDLTYTDNADNMSGLSNLTSIGGDLIFQTDYNSSYNLIVDINGLNNLQSVGGDLRITSNIWLTKITGLNNLENIGGQVLIQSNPSLAV